MRYQVEYTPQAVEDLKNLNPTTRSLIYGWIEKNLEGCEDPRRHGSGESAGGRWRYQIGGYRLLAEIQEGRIIILAVTTGLRRTSERTESGAGRIRPNVFLRSTLRQPVKTAMMLLITALITFAFVARVSEYLLVRQETERLGEYYRAVGTLEAKNGDHWTDTAGAIEYLEDSPYVASVTRYDYTSAVVQEDICNMNAADDECSFRTAFYGTLYSYDENAKNFYFKVDSVLVGYPEYISEGSTAVMFPSRYGHMENEADALAKLEKGSRYLVTGYYSKYASGCKVENVVEDGGETSRTYIQLTTVSEDSFFFPVAQDHAASWDDLEMIGAAEYIQDDWDDQRALNIIPVQDMRDLPLVQNAANGFVLEEGRWLTGEDDALERKVCVIDTEFAAARGLEVGDALTLRLRDIPSWFGAFYTNTERSVEELLAGKGEDRTDRYEIVGTYRYLYEYNASFISSVHNFAYIPRSAVPDDFVMTTVEDLDAMCDYNAPNLTGRQMFDEVRSEFGDVYSTLPYPNAVSFTLTSPDVEDQFAAECQKDLAAMGWEVTMLENNWQSFQAAAGPMRQSSLLNAVIYSALLLVTACLIAAVYYRMRRKDAAIARALGLSAGRCARQAVLPLLGIAFLGAGAGGWLGWRYTLASGGRILETLGGTGEAALSCRWLAAALGAALLLLLAAAVTGAVDLAVRPVLPLLQGGAAVKENAVPEVQSGVPQAVRVSAPAFAGGAPTAVRGRGKGVVHTLRFVWRHTVRSKVKTCLSFLLALGFTAGLAAIQLSIVSSQEKMDWLYEHTSVEAELVQAGASQSVIDSGLILGSTVDALLESGYVTSVYLEGMTSGGVAPYTEALENGSIYTETVKAFRGLSDGSVFLSAAGSGGTVAVSYFDGWDGGFFAQEWSRDSEVPVVLPRELYKELRIEGDGLVGLVRGGSWTCRVAGYYEGEVSGSHDDPTPILIPLSVYQAMGGRRVTYSKAHVTLVPSLNRELEPFTEFLTEVTAGQGTGVTALRAVVWDDELRMAVAPLENSIVLMRVLYPVILALSLLVAAGIAVLFVMTSAKEAAIMRVLGTSRLRSGVMLALQTAFTSAAGLAAGLLGVLAYTGRVRPEMFAHLLGASALCAALYLLAAILGAAASASAVTGKNPLELLQVKE